VDVVHRAGQHLLPEESDSSYPYTADGDRRFLLDKPFIEPFSLIPAMGAVTSACASRPSS
jgi:hypothetical protein